MGSPSTEIFAVKNANPERALLFNTSTETFVEVLSTTARDEVMATDHHLIDVTGNEFREEQFREQQVKQ